MIKIERLNEAKTMFLRENANYDTLYVYVMFVNCLDTQNPCPLALSRRQTVRQSPRSHALCERQRYGALCLLAPRLSISWVACRYYMKVHLYNV